ncbi:hypothetical protein K431DRAFT_70040 [Polychaeton citri CBS 116435]|uniref:Uncharacterized protein n=1 Tax=Polychaeton citri CBS 116435 TaxID=1314669 RepID=A0A9P4Q6C2_9PEZI|nr:hypothetical protein K431DRAFT_70040 [Polychaeton citri CBS 116435]
MTNIAQIELPKLSQEITQLAARLGNIHQSQAKRRSEIVRREAELKALRNQDTDDSVQIQAINEEAGRLCVMFKYYNDSSKEGFNLSEQDTSETEEFDAALEALLDDGDEVATQNTNRTLTEDMLRQIEEADDTPAASAIGRVNHGRSLELEEVAGVRKRWLEEQEQSDHDIDVRATRDSDARPNRESTMRIDQEHGSGRKHVTPKRRCTEKTKGYYWGMPEDESEAYARNA